MIHSLTSTLTPLLRALTRGFRQRSPSMIVLPLGMDLGLSHLGMARAGSGLDLVASLSRGLVVGVMERRDRGSICFDDCSIFLLAVHSAFVFRSHWARYTYERTRSFIPLSTEIAFTLVSSTGVHYTRNQFVVCSFGIVHVHKSYMCMFSRLWACAFVHDTLDDQGTASLPKDGFKCSALITHVSPSGIFEHNVSPVICYAYFLLKIGKEALAIFFV